METDPKRRDLQRQIRAMCGMTQPELVKAMAKIEGTTQAAIKRLRGDELEATVYRALNEHRRVH